MSSPSVDGVLRAFSLMVPIVLTVEHAERFRALCEAIHRGVEAELRAHLHERLARALQARVDQVARAEAIYRSTR